MKDIGTLIKAQRAEQGFPMCGVNGYGGEQDGTRAVLTAMMRFTSRKAASDAFPDGVPEYVRLHWARFTPGRGWECVFGWWSDQPTEGDGNPLATLY
jgi:hypothetical protein